ncbi:MAG TPA: PAS domain S-box protein, partial [Methanoregula sp.]|nr:PAS domain S-box protein [Methanoregula sp.]
MAPDPGPLPRNPPVSIPGAKPEQLLFTRLAIVSGLLAAAVSLLGLVSAHSGLIVLGGTSPNSRAIALSAALAWIVLGSVLAYSAARPFGRAARLAVQAVLFVIAALAATEFGFSVLGSHFFVETLFVQAGTVVLGPLSYPVSPVAAGLVAASAVALAALLRSRDHGSGRETWRTAMSIPGIAIALVSFTFILSYAYGDPLLYGTRFIPIALLSALAAFFTGVAIVAAAGPGAVPARYLIGDSTSARLLRVFIPLVAAIIILENFAFVGLASVFGVRDVVLLSASLVVFLIVTAYGVARASGGIGKALDEAEAALAKKNEDLANLNEELSATGEELRQTNDELVAHERRLVRQNEDLNAINEELTSTQEELRQTIDDLTRMETILRESEERFRSVLDSSRDFIYRLNLQTGVYEYVSPSVNYVLGYTPEEFAALDPGAAMERVHPDDLAAVNEGLKGLSETGSADMEYRLRTKSGEYRWVSNILSTANDRAGRPLYRGGSVRDITRRKEVEEQIQATLQRFYHILSGMPYGILLVTDEDRVEFANQAFCDIFGLSDCPGELANITAARMMEKIRHAYRDPDAALARIREIVGNGEPVSGEDVPMSSGRVFLRDFLPVRLGEKRSGRLWIHVDITARRQAEEALRQSERRLARSQEISHLGSWELDLVNNRLAWSDEVYRIFGLRPQEFGATYEAFLAAVHPDDRSAVDAAYSGSLREGRDTYEIEHRVVRKDTGEIRYVHEKCEHQRDENGKIIRSVGMVHDITERKKAEDALREAEARFRLALKNAPVSVAVQDKNLVFRWAYNQRTRSTGEIVGKTDADLFAPEDMEWLLPLKHKVLETGSEVRAENWVTSNGQRVFLDLYLEPIRNPAGEITGIGIAAVNLTELKIAEDALREAQLRTTAILEGIADTFYSLDDQWRFTMVNPAAEKAPFGRPAADLLGRVIWDLYPELVGTKIHRHYLDAAKKESMEHYESRSPLNGRWYEVFMKGQKGGVDVYMRDITGRRQAEEALRESEEKYRNLFTNMTEEVHFWKLVRDEEGRIVT